MSPAATTQETAPSHAPGPSKGAAAASTLAPSVEHDKAAELVDRLIHKLLNNEDTNKEFLLPLADGRIIDTKGWNGWEWTHGVALFALWEHHALTADRRSLDIITKWFHDRMAEGGTTKNINTMAPFLALASIYERNPRPQYKEWLLEWAEWAMNGLPKTHEGGFQHMTYIDDHDGQLWDDTLMMTVLPLAKIGLVLDRPEFVDEAKYQFLVHIKYLSDSRTGLWYHGWNFNGRHNFAKALWARGNCWITVAIPVFLSLLGVQPDTSDFFTRTLLATLRAQLDQLTKLQDPQTGLFHTLLDDPNSYLESSATAGFAAGTLLALRNGFLSSSPNAAAYASMAQKALGGVVSMIADDGELQNTSFGTAMGNDLDFYRNIAITPMPYGQALALFAVVQDMALATKP
ncbi:uncharacterized protein PFL1_06808 [Pseudozyma flocculosa PF-1]|uniref:Related to unsaturated glucuronyl hydrolase involved in regulation of bacterial surface properties, and related proteins n=2 Tax=Pseudozyma flocculosa TaxID=84751 RepID=A0A5C3F5M3_9BASI|nr:uncharacterized protein PFL1_06808 [Pseudozyma flocculosa PF-1]EPQ25628.1 hypothetical protein PFL1_06808 [Pseudozyma flocculosa PF-1]SPO38551.1 related to unsaturated glucuronyl hydrolase involved in regulation of bacterial surface properties, and related proteins [Pseudozyma flocculosa]